MARPKPIKKDKTPATPAPAPAVAAETQTPPATISGGLPVEYPEFTPQLYDGDNVLTAEVAKAWLGWEETADPAGATLTDHHGKSVRLLKNAHNRPFNEERCRRYAQDILNRKWADSRNGPGQTMNGEAIIIGRHGNVVSGQKRLAALIIAEQRRQAEKDHWKTLWPDPVSIEALVVFGVDESPATLRTLDDVEPRTIAQVFYAEGLFAGIPQKDAQRLDKMTEYAIRTLWERTWLKQDGFSGELTNSEAVAFVDRHPHAVQAVRHIYDCLDKVKSFKLVSPGTASGLLYLMGCSASEVGETGSVNTYRDARDESVLDWTNWDRAKLFWSNLINYCYKSDKDGGQWHRVSLARVTGAKDGDHTAYIFAQGLGQGRPASERVGVVIQAWKTFLDHHKITDEALALTYSPPDEDGDVHLVSYPLIGGIDFGRPQEQDEPEEGEEDASDPEAVERRTAKVRKEKQGGLKPLADQAWKDLTLEQQVQRLKTEYPDKVILWQAKDGGGYYAWGKDAEVVAKACGLKVSTRPGDDLARVSFTEDKFPDHLAELVKAKHVVAIVTEVDGNPQVRPAGAKAPSSVVTPPPKTEPAKPPAPKLKKRPTPLKK